MPLSDNKISAWENPIVTEADQPKRSAAEMKGIFDANSNQLKAALNAVIDALIAEGGSGEIGSAQVGEGVPAGSIFSQLVKLREILDDRVQTIEVGVVETLPTGEPATVTITGAMPNIKINFALPKGNTGDNAAPHAAQHAKEGEDPITPESIGAADLNHAARHATEGEDPITPASIGAAPEAIELTGIMLAGGWVNGVQTVTVNGIIVDSKGSIGLNAPTQAQREAARIAQMSLTAQGENSVTITADGTAPGIDIPFKILIVG